MINRIEQRVWFWRVVQYWNILRQRLGFILATIAFSVFITIIVRGSSPPVFASRTIIRINKEQPEGCMRESVPEVICGPLQENSPVL